MSRPKLTSLSDLMPTKGEATRPEPVVEHKGVETSKQAREHEGNHGGVHENHHAGLLAREQARESALKLKIPGDPSDYQDGPRSAVSFRMTERLQDRLREYAHKSRRKKQDILDQAVHEFLRREGF